MKLFDTTLTRLQQSLDVRLVEHNVLAGNVANADTPGYRPKELDFSEAMAAARQAEAGGALAATDARHMSTSGELAGSDVGARTSDIASLMVREGAGGSASLDGNQVDVDRTMAGLAENALQYGASARAAAKKLAIMRYVITEGGG